MIAAHRLANLVRKCGIAAVVIILMAACAPAAPGTAVPSAPVTRSSSPTPLVITIAAPPPTVDMQNAAQIAEGQARYEALECGVCHGENGRGTDKGPPLVELKLAEEDFMKVLRTGGALGSNHVYPTNRLTDADGNNLYLYVLSFNGGN
jgi:mono/diheme cytochrome c family protein